MPNTRMTSGWAVPSFQPLPLGGGGGAAKGLYWNVKRRPGLDIPGPWTACVVVAITRVHELDTERVAISAMELVRWCLRALHCPRSAAGHMARMFRLLYEAGVCSSFAFEDWIEGATDVPDKGKVCCRARRTFSTRVLSPPQSLWFLDSRRLRLNSQAHSMFSSFGNASPNSSVLGQVKDLLAGGGGGLDEGLL